MAVARWVALLNEPREIGESNLLCADGLPYADNVLELSKRLADWSKIVQNGIETAHHHRHKYRRLTDAQYKMLVMVTVLQRDLGVTYNHAFSEGEYDATDSRNLFLHGLLTGHGGTCVTMPVLYVAIGRRLGFPLKLVKAKEHLFCRWDGDERFNIEATARGFLSHPDEYYLQWPKPIARKEVERGWFLRSLTEKEELAQFLAQRGTCWMDHLQTRAAVECYYHAHQLAPDDPEHHDQWGVHSLASFAGRYERRAQVIAICSRYKNQLSQSTAFGESSPSGGRAGISADSQESNGARTTSRSHSLFSTGCVLCMIPQSVSFSAKTH